MKVKIYASCDKKQEINNLDEWFNLCPPKGKEKQWKDKRSAKEMAKFWLDENNCENFKRFICEKIEDFEFDYIIPERRSKFDDFKSPRKHDLFILSKDKKTIITIEGKADESFGNSFDETFKKAICEKILENKSEKLDRIINLYQKFFNKNGAVLSIMYQLTHWFAGSLSDAETKGAENIIMVLQEFRSGLTSDTKVKTNHKKFDEFIKFISEEQYTTIFDENTDKPMKNIVGPITNKYTHSKKLYIGYFPFDL
jgi:hypothetical protein